MGRKRRYAHERAIDWVRNNGYDSSRAEGLKFFQYMERQAEAGDFQAACWVPGAKAQAGRQELMRAANADRIRVRTQAGPRDTPIRGSIRVQEPGEVWHQRSLFSMMSVGEYRDWFADGIRKLLRDGGALSAHGRMIAALDEFPDDIPVAEALRQLGLTWEALMQDAA